MVRAFAWFSSCLQYLKVITDLWQPPQGGRIEHLSHGLTGFGDHAPDPILGQWVEWEVSFRAPDSVFMLNCKSSTGRQAGFFQS